MMKASEMVGKLKAGKKLELGKLLPGVSAESVKWVVLESGDEESVLEATYFGIALGEFRLWVNKQNTLSIRRLV